MLSHEGFLDGLTKVFSFIVITIIIRFIIKFSGVDWRLVLVLAIDFHFECSFH